MENYYILMHKDVRCGIILLDEDDGSLESVSITNTEYAPFLGSVDIRLMKKWWNSRAVPGTRQDMEAIIRESGVENNLEYLAKNLALSITDTYWVCPIDVDLSWEGVNLFRGLGAQGNFIPYHNATSYDPNASLGGQMNKYWDMSGDDPILIKMAYLAYGQQAINEVLATNIHQRLAAGIPYVSYNCSAMENGILSKCKAFTNPDVEFVSAYEVIFSRKRNNQVSDYDEYINICVEHGIDMSDVQAYMDYQTVTDFLISNSDEHLLNFGVLRDANTMKLLGPAPIFDSGNSMFFRENRVKPYSRAEILDREITSFYKKEEQLLKKVRNRRIIDLDRIPTRDEVKTLYESYYMPEERAEFLAANYQVKCELLSDFQKGRTISFYHEKKHDES